MSSVLALSASVASPSIAGTQSEDDPVFAAIEAHRAAVRAHSEAVSREGDAEDTPTARERSRIIDGMEERIKSALAAGEQGDKEDKLLQGIVAKAIEHDGNRFYPRLVAIGLSREGCPDLFVESPEEEAAMKEARTRCAEASEAMDEAALAMIYPPPVTLAGVIALMEYVVEFEDCGNLWPDAVLVEQSEGEDAKERSFKNVLLSDLAKVLADLGAGVVAKMDGLDRVS